jgi:cobalt-zinc-cadmium efflux system membrane fusion protein
MTRQEKIRMKIDLSEKSLVTIVTSVALFTCALLLFIPIQQEGDGHEDGHEDGRDKAAIEIKDETLRSAGMVLEKAESRQILPTIMVRGQIIENTNHAMNVKPRFSGTVKAVNKDFGDHVRKGDLLAVIESATTRAVYSIRSATDGIVADKKVVVGAFVPEGESIFRIVDLTNVWFQAAVPISDGEHLKVGQTAEVTDRRLFTAGKGLVFYLSPVVEEDSQARELRIDLENKTSSWRVGSFAEAKVFLAPLAAKVAVKSTAIQSLNGQTVVFKRVDDLLLAVPVVTGVTDDDWAEIVSGLDLKSIYLSENSFLAKAEMLKSSAAHEH